MPIQLQGSEINNLDAASASITASVNVTATSSATGTTCMTTGVFTAPFSGDYYVEIFTPFLTKGTTNMDIELFSGASAATGTFVATLSGHMTASSVLGQGIFLAARVTLVAGANQLTVTGFVDAGTGVFGAGTGATGQPPPARMRVRST
jgi:hypothetical protein